ncbi:MAG: helix-turn-helix domain-containing protein [Blastocatellia bacterium]
MAESRGLTSSYQLQHALGVAPTVAVRLWRNVVTRFSLDTLNKLCEVLECQPGDLLVYEADAPLSPAPRRRTGQGRTRA